MKTLRSAIFALGLLLVVSVAHAQTTNVSAKIPFDFVVGKQVLPAGQYLVKSLSDANSALMIRNSDEPDTQITLSRACEKLNPAEKTVLVFHRIGDQYFLSQVWIEGSARGREIPASSVEKQMAKNHLDREEVIVAALVIR